MDSLAVGRTQPAKFLNKHLSVAYYWRLFSSPRARLRAHLHKCNAVIKIPQFLSCGSFDSCIALDSNKLHSFVCLCGSAYSGLVMLSKVQEWCKLVNQAGAQFLSRLYLMYFLLILKLSWAWWHRHFETNLLGGGRTRLVVKTLSEKLGQVF